MSKSNKRTFIEFACTYFAVITLVLVALFPIYSALIQAECEKNTQSVYDYAKSKTRELEAKENFLFHTARNIFADQELQNLYYGSNGTEAPSLFYDMSQLQKRLKLYSQNISDIQDVIVYIPKFDYVLTQQYIFRTREQFYQHIRSSAHDSEDWLEYFFEPRFNTAVVPDSFTDVIQNTGTHSVMNHLFVFPMNGDSNIRLLVMVSLDSDATAKQLLLPELQNRGSVVIKDSNGTLLAESPNRISLNNSDINSDPADQIQFTSSKGKQIFIDIDESYFSETRNAILILIVKNIGITLVLGACTALYFAWNRSRPIERILNLIRKASIANGGVAKLGDLEDVVVSMASEIHQCKNTIKDLDGIVNNSLLERLFFGDFNPQKIQEAFIQCYGPMPDSCLIVVFGAEEMLVDCEMLKIRIHEMLDSMDVSPYVIHHQEQHVYLLTSETPDIRVTLELLLKNLRDDGHGIIKAGISNTVSSLTGVKKGTEQAQRRLNSGIHIHGAYLFSHTYSSKATLNPVSLHSLDLLSKALLTWDQQTTDRTLEEVLSHCEPSRLDAVELRQLFFSLRNIYSTVIHQFIIDTDEADTTLDEIFFLPNDLDDYSIETIRTTFKNLNAAMHSHYQKRQDKRARVKGMDILTYVEENFKNPNLCASSIAAHFHVSEKYVFQLFKKASAESLNDKISFLRVQEGIRLLENTDMNVSEVAEAVGFTSPNTMYKVFMRVIGISPSSYRKNKT